MGQDVGFSCECGMIGGSLRDMSEKTGTGVICYCSRCRAAEVFLDQEDPLDDGVALFQTTLDRVHFDRGADQMYAFSFEAGGLIRWYAKCCKVPLFNTMASPKSGFVSVMVDRLDDPAPLGRIRAAVFQKDETGKQRHQGLRHVILGGTRRSAAMKLSGKWKDNPFFGKSGAPVTRVHVLSDIETSQLPLEKIKKKK